jgi:multimeric flavodoxin WrbA
MSAATAKLLIVHHTVSPSLHDMVDAVRSGTGADGIEGVEVTTSAALSTTPSHALDADGYLLVAPANLGSMAGALKHFFDTIYYPCLDETRGRPFGCALHGNNDVDGALRDLDKIVTGLGWSQVGDHVRVVGTPDQDAKDACWNLGATLAATLMT